MRICLKLFRFVHIHKLVSTYQKRFIGITWWVCLCLRLWISIIVFSCGLLLEPQIHFAYELEFRIVCEFSSGIYPFRRHSANSWLFNWVSFCWQTADFSKVTAFKLKKKKMGFRLDIVCNIVSSRGKMCANRFTSYFTTRWSTTKLNFCFRMIVNFDEFSARAPHDLFLRRVSFDV